MTRTRWRMTPYGLVEIDAEPMQVREQAAWVRMPPSSGLRTAQQVASDAGRERRAREERDRAWRQRQEAIRARLAEVRAAVEDQPVLRAVVAHHIPDPSDVSWPHLECEGCDEGFRSEGPADWPCSTWTLIETALGLDPTP